MPVIVASLRSAVPASVVIDSGPTRSVHAASTSSATTPSTNGSSPAIFGRPRGMNPHTSSSMPSTASSASIGSAPAHSSDVGTRPSDAASASTAWIVVSCA